MSRHKDENSVLSYKHETPRYVTSSGRSERVFLQTRNTPSCHVIRTRRACYLINTRHSVMSLHQDETSVLSYKHETLRHVTSSGRNERVILQTRNTPSCHVIRTRRACYLKKTRHPVMSLHQDETSVLSYKHETLRHVTS
jgi:hypothetical protein